jgi:hypothetical protein
LQLAPGLRVQFPPSKFLPALQRLAAAHDALGELPNWLQPKGVGVICVAENGMQKDSFVHFYFGKMYEHRTRVRGLSRVSRDVPLSYPPSKWFEREAAIEVIKVTTSARACISQPQQADSFAEPRARDQRASRRLLQYGARCTGVTAWRILPPVLPPSPSLFLSPPLSPFCPSIPMPYDALGSLFPLCSVSF